MRVHSVNVRELAEFTLLRGDLMPANTLLRYLNQGTIGHQRLQRMLDPEWCIEAPVKRTEIVDGVTLEIQGRADALLREDGILRVLEIKTTTAHPKSIGVDRYPAHLAQAVLYAYLFCANEGVPRAEVRLTYTRLDGLQNTHHRRYEFEELRALFLQYARAYAAWLKTLDARREESLPTLTGMTFPFPETRPGQAEMADEVYTALASASNALIEAPTGIGKTAASLFGALKALGEQRVTALFYLTARTTGRRAAEQALALLRSQGVKLHSISITAKEKICLLGTADCFSCPYASNYYGRRQPALNEGGVLLHIGADELTGLALKHELCPYELSLDLSEICDVIICDYNYAFDPRVKLRRWFDHKSGAGLLIDEAHNLPNRASEMFSAEISGKRVAALLTGVVAVQGAYGEAALALTDLYAALMRKPDEDGEEARCEALTEVPETYLRAAQAFCDATEEIDYVDRAFSTFKYDVAYFVKCASSFKDESMRVLVMPEEKTFLVRIWCFDPSQPLKKAYKRVHGVALFSATLAPPDHYARLLGLNLRGEDSLLQLDSPFPPENQLTLRVPISVKYRDRGDTLHAVARVLHEMAQAHTGNYLACFPSFAYLEAAVREYCFCHPNARVIAQARSMDEKARADFIAAFEEHPKKSMIAFIVLGGVFAEGVDLPGSRLSGAAIISTGMPQIGFVHDVTRELFDDGFGAGIDAAYTFPGVRRVLQAGGRVIRTETDRGVVLLIDSRYREERIRDLMPPHWHVRGVTGVGSLRRALDAFWAKKTSG